MVKSTTSKQKPVSREILVKELSALENRFDAKIDSAVQSMKEYADSRWKQHDAGFGAWFDAIDHRFTKMEGYFEQLVGMISRQNKKMDKFLGRLDNHGHRITRLEEKVA